ncbi:MAG: S9 family peptidase [Phycisphaerales bacterium]|nr:MAG: S9 family peptidase [Phycisphaerales bacterium]
MRLSAKRARSSVGIALSVILMLSSACRLVGDTRDRIHYPETRKCDQVDDYHGVKVADPYRWLEESGSDETRRWIEAQNRVTFDYLGKIPARTRIRERLAQLWDYEKYGLPRKYGGKYFFTKKEGLQSQYVLHVVSSQGGKPRVLLDPNRLSEDGTVALRSYAVSEDGKLLTYGLSSVGSDWQEWKVRDVESGRDLSDHIKWVKFSSVSFTKDGKGFFYCGYDEPSEQGKYQDVSYHQKLLYHRIGTRQADDELVYHDPDKKDRLFRQTVSDDGRYLVISVEQGNVDANLILFIDLSAGDYKVEELITGFDAKYTFVDNDGPTFWLWTNSAAPRGRVIAIDTTKPERDNWREVIPEARATLRKVTTVGDHFVASYLEDARSRIRIHDLSGRFDRELPLPSMGTASGFWGERGDQETFYKHSSYIAPDTIYRLNIGTGASEVFRKPDVAFDPSDYVTTQVFYKSKDGTRVPMFLSYKRGLELNGNNPTYLYGYGGFNIVETPGFSVVRLAWMEMGGVLAVANIRGGGEYGEEWHHAGTKLRKQSTFDDFIAAAEWLIEMEYTSSQRLAIGGASNGGLLVGACMTQRPELFGACLPNVGVMDMLRFHEFTIGWAWVSDYGCSENPKEFAALYAYSPLHNLRMDTTYPATLITTADHDDRVVPGHSFKFTAALQEAQAGSAPVLIRVQTKAGHGAGTPTSMVIEEAADRWAFLVKALNMTVD